MTEPSQTAIENDRRANESCLFPNDRLAFHSIILYDVVKATDINKLFNGLEFFFKDGDPIIHQHLSEARTYFCSNLHRFSERQWTMATVLNKSEHSDKYLTNEVVKPLPSEIDNVEIHLYRKTPSIIILKFIANIREKDRYVIDEMLKIYDVSEESEPRYDHGGITWTDIGPPKIKEKRIRKYLDNLVWQIVQIFSEVIPGEFIAHRIMENSIIPTINVFSLNYPTIPSILDEWWLDSAEAFSCIGVSPYPDLISNNFLFLDNEINRSGGFENYSVVIKRSLLDDDQGVCRKVRREMAAHPFIDVPLQRLMVILENDFKKIYGDLQHYTSKSKFSFKRKKELEEIITKQKTIIEREYFISNFINERKESKRSDFFTDSDFVSYRGEPEQYHDIIEKRFAMDADHLTSYTGFVSNLLNASLEVRNVDFTKQAQWWALFLASIAIVIALIGIW